MLRPTREEFKRLAATHSVVPVWREVLADLITPVAAFARCVGDQTGFLLESVEHERWSRFSFVGRRPAATPIMASPAQLAEVTYNADGLVPGVVQEAGTGQVLMVAWMNEPTLRETLETGRTVFWSRSRQERWAKGDTSGDRQWVREAYYDCDGDVLLFVVEQEGKGACHTGERSCFFRAFGS